MEDFIQNQILPWLATSGLRILLILAGVYVLHRVLKLLVTRAIRKMIRTEDDATEEEKEAEQKREDTIINVLHTSIHVVLIVVTVLMVLSELGVDTGPILAAAGIGGLAFGFGAQYLIQDIINGLFILLENQYRVEDVVCFNGTCGTVENINLRRTVVRDLDGSVHHIPNREIKIATNMSQEYAQINLDVGVGYDSDIDHVINVINKTGKEFANDPDWQKDILDAPQFMRVNNFGDSAIEIKIFGKSTPGEQWAATGELRKRIKSAFDKEGINIPFKQVVVRQADKEKAEDKEN